ncbi:hypothetical protein PG999_013714 [Apiospora kogelbergensis]|uniref:Uncharacterized protein n=1 Tax=Apiospora kogelbergensis TaxID=1337665 RepID=A0AAW0Q7N5_9PEZI
MHVLSTLRAPVADGASEAVSTDDAASLPWESLIRRSIAAWKPPTSPKYPHFEDVLRRYTSMEQYLCEAPMGPMFYFFQRRESFLSKKRMPKWSRDNLEDYILLPAADGYVTRDECFFVSHFWHSAEHPDPDGTYLRLHQDCLGQQPWSYIWVDWTCLPQHPRSPEEEAYFTRALQTMSAIIREAGFSYFYPTFEPRLWILYEIAEYTLTATNRLAVTPDIKGFAEHVREMLHVGVRPTLERHGYRCTYDGDRDFLISWLELLVLLRKHVMDISDVRRILDLQTCSAVCDGGHFRCTVKLPDAVVLTAQYMDGNGQTMTTTVTKVRGMNAHGIKARFHTSELLPSQTPSSETTPAPPTLPTSDTPPVAIAADGHKLTGGAVAGIATGAALGGFALAVAGFLLWRKRHRMGRRGGEKLIRQETPDQHAAQQDFAQATGSNSGMPWKEEDNANYVKPPPNSPPPAELPAFRERGELDAVGYRS